MAPPNETVLSGKPDTFALTVLLGQSVQFKVVPKDDTGAVQDCTQVALVKDFAAIPTVANPGQFSALGSAAIPIGCTVISADATGIVLQIKKYQLQALNQAAFGLPVQCALRMWDGNQTYLLAATGTITLKPNAAVGY